MNSVNLLVGHRSGHGATYWILWQYFPQRPLNSVCRVIDELKLYRIHPRALLPAQKLDDLQRIADMVVEFSDGLHSRSHQIATGFGFPGHLPTQTAGKKSGKAIAED